jgi:hypothetical protein
LDSFSALIKSQGWNGLWCSSSYMNIHESPFDP